MKDVEQLNKQRAARLKKSREEANMTQDQLSEKSGYSIQTISYIENTKRGMSVEAAQIFAKCLNVRAKYLFCEDDYKCTIDILSSAENDERTENRFQDAITEHEYLDYAVPSSITEYFTHPESGEESYMYDIEKHIFIAPDNSYFVCSDEMYRDMINDLDDYVALKLKQLSKKSRPATPSEIAQFEEHYKIDEDFFGSHE